MKFKDIYNKIDFLQYVEDWLMNVVFADEDEYCHLSVSVTMKKIYHQPDDHKETAFQLSRIWTKYIDDKRYDLTYRSVRTEADEIHNCNARKNVVRDKYQQWLREFIDGYELKYVKPFIADTPLIGVLSI
jgi:hypothetical protein